MGLSALQPLNSTRVNTSMKRTLGKRLFNTQLHECSLPQVLPPRVRDVHKCPASSHPCQFTSELHLLLQLKTHALHVKQVFPFSFPRVPWWTPVNSWTITESVIVSEFLEDFSYKYVIVFYMRNLIHVTDLFNNEGAIILVSLFF